MTLPAFIFGVLISTFYGAAFHFWKGGGLGRLLLYLILGWAGFWTGHLVAGYLNWSFDSLGALHFGSATVGAVIFLAVGYWLSLVEVERK
jgi:uncharacterized membrane protein YeaQ/YmgE (transglycosylase-associated protein family)